MGCGARLRTRAPPRAQRRRPGQGARSRRGLHRPQVAIYGRALPAGGRAHGRRLRTGGTAARPGQAGTPGRAERDRVQLHPALTEKMLRRAAALDALNPVAACHHEKANGSGYLKGLTSHQLSPAARILGAADRYQAMTQRRAHRPTISPEAAATELRRMHSPIQGVGHSARLPASCSEATSDVSLRRWGRLVRQGRRLARGFAALNLSPCCRSGPTWVSGSRWST